MKLGQPIDLQLAPRYYQFNRSVAIRDVFDALVELITNCDDSYHRLYKKRLRAEDGGPILIEYCQQKDSSSFLIVHDRAEGMTLEEMKEKLGNVGTRRSEEGDRGFMARGAKDCTELGKLTVESIKDEKYYKCELTPKPQLIPLEDGKKATKEIRDRLRTQHGNGTTVTLETHHKMPRSGSIVRDLPWYFALRDILSTESDTKVHLKNLNRPKDRAEKLVYQRPDGELVCEETFEIPGYDGATASLKIWKSPEPFEETGDKTRRFGILVKGTRAIHECTLFAPEFEKDPYVKKYFGRLEAPWIDKILDEFDKRRENSEPHPDENPSLVIDPNRQHGLMRDHPFTRALFQIPRERLKTLLAKDREDELSKGQQISNHETQNRLDRLARKTSDFLKQQLEDIQELSDGVEIDKGGFAEHGVLIFPPFLNVALSEQRTLTYYVRKSLLDDSEQVVQVQTSDPALLVLDSPIKLRPHRTKDDRMIGTFRVRGEAIKDTVKISATSGSVSKAEATASIIENRIDEHIFDKPFEFEHDQYTVREGSRKSLTLFAKYPDLIAERTRVNVISTDSGGIPVRGACDLIPITGSNYARGEVVVQGRKLNAKAQISATVNGSKAETLVKVLQKPPEGIPLRFELKDEDFGNFRARWSDSEGQPNLLLISAQHKSLSRYLGPAPKFEGQNEPHFRVILAEIIAEAVCGKSLELECKERAWDFRFADLKDDHVIANEVRARMQRRLRDFVADAHAIMLSAAELKRLT